MVVKTFPPILLMPERLLRYFWVAMKVLGNWLVLEMGTMVEPSRFLLQ
jgi:hypothetical protein